MAKTYNTFTNVSTGDVYTAASHNAILQNLAGYRVPPSAAVPIATGATITNNTDTVLAFQAATFSADTDITVTTGAVSTTYANGGKVTVTTAGVYLVSYVVQFDSSGTGVRSATIAKNGTGSPSSATGTGWTQTAGQSAGSHSFGASVLMSLAANDYLQIAVRQTSGGNLGAIGNQGWLHLAWLGQVS